MKEGAAMISRTNHQNGMNDHSRRERSELKINGVSNIGGGEYNNVTVDGVGRFSGDVSVAGDSRVNGVLHIDGALNAQQLSCDGKLKIAGYLKARDVRIDGMANIGGAVAVELFKMNGMLTTNGDFEAEQLIVQGAMTIGGLLNADEIELGLMHLASRVKEVGGEKITVRRLSESKFHWLWRWAIPKGEVRFDVNLIEGNAVQLEYTHAEVVRGNRVVIGKGCKIGLVEYSDELIVHPDASVLEEVRVHD
ncbi:polymer-forming cytoskeletal protein [Paenibacillus sp. L3-i20]|uniref:polymer-forming cytoskeletal protein n=1 Tax=Paenibacillus sp. L3-i20 TaxID=2905833 RepID=UPI001EDDD3DF|nr:polymer-forming cytoskeletal protein [Paenibacillus sp. L3-i20]GKU77924.1 hypothetical protein L3i20_v223210 [Paenibacillus sp. L3-i20]